MESANILIVEDDVLQAEQLKLQLQQAGYRIAAVVPTGEQAVARVEQGGIDLMIVDIILSGIIDGIEAVRQIHEKYAIPTIYLTAYIYDDMLLRAERTQPFAYILKPCQPGEIEFMVKMCLARARIESELAAQKLAAENEKEKLQRELNQAHKMQALGQLSSGIAHDFNNILNIIMGYLDVSLRRYGDEIPKKMVSNLETAMQASERARDLVAQMMTFSRIDIEAEQPIQFAAVLEENVKMLRSILPSSISIQLHCEKALPMVLMDSAKLQQLLMNLCINAKDAMDGVGKLMIQLGWHRDVNAECACCHKVVKGDWIELAVSDNGSGMMPETLEHLFEPFYTTKEIGKGTGMGMSVLHGIVTAHGGHVLVETAPGKGSTFRLLFAPAVEAVQPEIEALAAIPVTDEPAVIDPAVGAGKQVLVLDDEPMIAEYLADMLAIHGFQTTVKTDSEEMLQLFRNNPGKFDLLITDQTMPGLTGIELIKQLRQIRPGFPVILCSGYSEDISATVVEDMGIFYQTKPIDSGKLVRSIVEILH